RCAGSSELRDALEELRYPIRQLTRSNAQQVQAAQRVLTETRRLLYLILAETPEEEASQQ
ncbi:MAG: PadR family transcriptional regulator, partial [Actinomycetota bacterium]|nr:PadR family transcriptional regulator [Actinomycetota bacterium]